jgi:GPH family glycoside/pentoside/hexuronide:cation symporter
MAGFSLNLYETVLVTWIMFYYIPPEGSGRIQFISMAAFGTIMALGRILDAVTDPIIGFWSDNTQTRWGRRRPFIFVASPILLVAFVLSWLPPVRGVSPINALYLGATLFVYYWAYTAVLIPWFAVLPEMHQENRARMKVASVGVAIGVMGALVGGGVSGPLMTSLGTLPMAMILGGLAFLASECTLFGIDERTQVDNMALGVKGFFKVLREVLSDRQVLSFAAMIVLVQSTYQLIMINAPYFATLILGTDASGSSRLIGKIIIIIALATPFWYWMMRRFPKRRVMRGISLWMAVGYLLCFWVGRWPVFSINTQAMLSVATVAIPMGGMFVAAIGLIADITDYDELKHGKRREAIYYGIYGIVRKTGWAFCSLIALAAYRAFGYSSANPFGVQVVWLVCAAACFLSFFVFIPYRLGDNPEQTRESMNLEEDCTT